MANDHMKRCSLRLIIKEMQIKTTVNYHYLPTRMAKIKKMIVLNCWQGCGETGIFIQCWLEYKMSCPLWISLAICLKLKHTLTI